VEPSTRTTHTSATRLPSQESTDRAERDSASKEDARDAEFLRRALALAQLGWGQTAPNPMVGAVVVRDGVVVGGGYHAHYGEPHAEAVALKAAGGRARGSTMYVTLEPCTHWGRTPPCVDALIAAGVAEVHIAMLDPNPAVDGAGVARLREHGVRVTIGEGSASAQNLVEAHGQYIRHGTPFLTLSLCPSDGTLRALQARVDAILTDQAPAAYEADTRPAIPLTIVYSGGGSEASAVGMRLVWPGSWSLDGEVRSVAGVSQEVDLPSLLRELGRHQITSCLVRGSAEFAQALLAAHAIHKVVLPENGSVPPGFSVRGPVAFDGSTDLAAYPALGSAPTSSS